MEAITKGSKVPRVKAVCEKCGTSFERSAVHPYIIHCTDCRQEASKDKKRMKHDRMVFSKHMKCKECLAMISGLRKVGMYRCTKCKDQWWSTDDGWWRRMTDDAVFQNGEYRGTLGEKTYEEIRNLPPMEVDLTGAIYKS